MYVRACNICIVMLLVHVSIKKQCVDPIRSQHNLMQKSAQTVDALNGSAQGISDMYDSVQTHNAHTYHHIVGILARMFDALRRSQTSPPHKSNLFSLAGSKKILSGSTEILPSIVSPTRGVTRFNEKEYKELQVLTDHLSI